MIIIYKNADFSGLDLGKINLNYEVETQELASVTNYSSEKLDIIDLFFKSVKTFKGKIGKAFLFNESWEDAKYNIFNVNETLVKFGNPTINNSGYQPSEGNFLLVNDKYTNQTGNMMVYLASNITTGNSQILIGSDVKSGSDLMYMTNDFGGLGAVANFDGRIESNATKYLDKGAYMLNIESSVTKKMYKDGVEILSGVNDSGGKITTDYIGIGSFQDGSISSTGKIGFASLLIDNDFTNAMTPSEILTYSNAINGLMSGLEA